MKLKQIFFIFLILSLQSTLLAKVIPALATLVEKGETLNKNFEENYYLDKASSIYAVAISPNGENIVSGSYDNSIKIWNLKSGELLKESLEGKRGNWLVKVLDSSPKIFFRGDDGTFLYEKENNGTLKLALPKLPKKDLFDLKRDNRKIMTINEQVYPYSLTVQNRNNKPLYWLERAYHDEYCTLLPTRVSNIEANSEQNITLNFNCSLPQNNPKPIENHKIELVFETATQNKVRVPLTLSIHYANLKAIKAERLSLERLVLGYVLGKRKGDSNYQIPLMKRQRLEDDLEFLIEEEVEGLRC